MKAIAQLFSILFHPLLVPTYCFLFLIMSNGYMFGHINSAEGMRLLMVGFINTFLFPVFCIFLMKMLGFIDDYELRDRRQRVLPYMAVSFFFIWSYLALRKAFNYELLSDVMLGAGIAVSAALVVNILMYKISLHTIGMGGLFALVVFTIIAGIPIYNMTWILIAVILIAGIVGSSRLFLKAHDNKEVFSGYALGFFCMFIAFLF